MTTHIRKDAHGNWKAETSIPINATLRLKLSTNKVSTGHLVTTLTACTVDGIWETHKLYVDLYKRLEVSKPARCTEKVVTEQHRRFDINHLVGDARTFYKLDVAVA